MPKTILLDYETDSLERFREVGEILAKIDIEGVPVHEALGLPEPPQAPQAPYGSMMQQFMSHLTGRGED